MIPLLLALAAIPLRPQPTSVRIFGEWAVACDNVRRCEGASLSPGVGADNDVEMRMSREPGRDAPLQIAFKVAYQPTEIVRFVVDGAVVTQVRTDKDTAATIIDGGALAARLANASMAAISDGNHLANIPVEGASAMLRYMDAIQGRAGTVTAVVAKGAAPATAVPSAPPMPVIHAVAIADAGARKVVDLDTSQLRRLVGCSDDDSGEDDSRAWQLDSRSVYVGVYCGDPPSNMMTVPVIIRDGKAAAASLDTMQAGETVPLLANVGWTGKPAMLVTRYLKRGLGDCGVAQSYVWDGTRLRLVLQQEMPACRGVTTWLTTWRADAREDQR